MNTSLEGFGFLYNKKLFILSVSLNIIVLFIGLVFFFRIEDFSFGKDSISRNQNSNPNVEIRTDSLSLVGENSKDIVFLGDSHVDYFEWGEYFAEESIANRGVGSDITSNILQRIEEVNRLKPKKVFIMAGINDIHVNNISAQKITDNYQKIVNEIHEQNPEAEIYIHSVLAVNEKKYKNYYFQDGKSINEAVINLNENLKSLTGENLHYVDLYSELVKNGQLDERATVDGVHLNKKGYEVWINEIEEYVTE